MAKKQKTETVVIETFDEYDFNGEIDEVIKRLKFYQAEGKAMGLTNICIETDVADEAVYEYGGYQGNYEKVWTTVIKGDKE